MSTKSHLGGLPFSPVFSADIPGTLAHLGKLISQLRNLDDFLNLPQTILPFAEVESGQRAIEVEVFKVPKQFGAAGIPTAVVVSSAATIIPVVRIRSLSALPLCCLGVLLLVGFFAWLALSLPGTRLSIGLTLLRFALTGLLPLAPCCSGLSSCSSAWPRPWPSGPPVRLAGPGRGRAAGFPGAHPPRVALCPDPAGLRGFLPPIGQADWVRCPAARGRPVAR